MKNLEILSTVLLCALILSCEQQMGENEYSPVAGTFILNNGSWGANDSNIGIYHPSTKVYSPDAFLIVNGQKLGDLGQDIIALGDELFIAVNGSKTIFVTDLNLKIKRQINAEKDGNRLSPKYLAAIGSKVYVTYYEGFVGEIASDYKVRLCEVGTSPEGICASGERLYVANSGGALYPEYSNTVSVVSAHDFEESATIEVNVNPSGMVASSDGEYVYVLSRGNYADTPAMLQRIRVSDGTVENLDFTSVSAIAKGADDVLYILCAGYDENWNQLPGTVLKYDMKQNANLGNFVTDGTILNNAYSISATSDGYVYVGCSDYVNTGDMYVFTTEGTLYDKFDTQGINPLMAY